MTGHLVTDSEEMQKVACEANAIKKLSEIILKAKSSLSDTPDSYSTHHADKLKESALSAIAAITLFKDDYRKQVIETGLIPSIVAAMSSSVPGIRAAACQCTRSLSRSVCILRTNLVDAGIAIPLFKLLSDPSLEVRIAATGAVCNLMLEFSPMRRAILEQGAMKILCQHTCSEYAQLRLNAVWALKHFCYQPDEPIQIEQMLQELGYEQLLKLCEDEDIGVQEQALSVIRNVMTGEVKCIGMLFDNIGAGRLMKLIVAKLHSVYPEIVGAVFSMLVDFLTLGCVYLCTYWFWNGSPSQRAHFEHGSPQGHSTPHGLPLRYGPHRLCLDDHQPHRHRRNHRRKRYPLQR